ncbi:uncharacterized protein LOC121253567 [Juglans microcarpa x Juglans regia]|uniref:uncharacterized protein LOC121253567 n=1 Tax=Juglans microcarpa x Juglans regia TaxID=2249226 RepID=UPI001B7ECF14|nr:uncharacterized protein LOC121253567 [Juglans microcarpa x Juglans regia]
MDQKLLERALEECDDDLDSAIRSLNEFRLGSTDNNLGFTTTKCDVTLEANVQSLGEVTTNGHVVADEKLSTPQNPTMDATDWVELFVRDMMSASNVDDARARTSRVFEILERSIHARASAKVNNYTLTMHLKQAQESNSIPDRFHPDAF